MTEWNELFNRASKPRITEIRSYMNSNTFEAFEHFNKILLEKYNLGYVLPRYTKKYGWTYSYGRSGYILVKSVVFKSDKFSVEGIDVSDLADLNGAIALVDEMFNDGFLVQFAAFEEKRTARRKEKQLQNAGKDCELIYKHNCTWCKKVSRNDLHRLYKSESLGLLDENLLEDIGLTLYIRCKLAKEIYYLMELGQIKCLYCGDVIGGGGIIKCKCGREYKYHSYRKSFREDNMPRGAASPIFDKFVDDWEKSKNPQEKMQLIDNLVHEFHIAEISGKKGRPVGVNLLQGTKKQIIELIVELATFNITASKVKLN